MSPAAPDLAMVALASPLRRPSVARAVAISVGLLLLLAAIILCAVVGGLGSEATQVFLKALAVSSLLSVLPVLLLWYLDRRERESPWLFAAAFLWGGLIATTIALPANTAVILGVAHWLEDNVALREMLGPDAALMIGAPLSAPIVEETAKGIGIVLLFWLMRAEFDNVRDGFVYGALVGAGFNWFESALYVQQNFVQFGSAPFGFQLGSRYAWLGLAGHAMFSGMFGASLGLARATRSRLVRWLAPVAGLLLAILAHAWNNSLPLVAAIVASKAGEAPPTESVAPPDLGLLEAMVSASISNLVIFLPFVALLVWIIRHSGQAERTVIREELSDEVGQAVTPAEYATILADRRYRTRRIDARNKAASAALVNAQNELAFRKRRLRDRGYDPADDPLVARRRAEINALRDRLDA
jgi:RsiW-degrading membrane proteinase PrsW (M82 family)